jgi:hypothetical protein
VKRSPGRVVFFFLKLLPFLTLKNYREGFGVGIGLSYEKLTLTIVTIYIAGTGLLNSRLPADIDTSIWKTDEILLERCNFLMPKMYILQ